MGADVQDTSPEEIISQGDNLARSGNYAGALDCFRNAVSLFPDNVTARAALANVLVVLGQPQKDEVLLREALDQALRALDMDSAHFIALLNAGKASKMLGERAQAIQFFERAVEARPDVAQPHLWLGILHTDDKRYTRATTHLKKVLEIDPNAIEAHMTLGLIHLAQSRVRANLDRLNQAIQEFEEVLRLNPNRGDALMELGMAYHYCERNVEATECYRKLVALAPENPKAHYHYGTLLARVGESVRALGHFTQAIALKPTYIEAYVSKAMVQEQLNQLNEAQKTLAEAEAQSPENPKLLMPRAKIESRLKHNDAALAAFSKALEAKVLTMKEQGFVQNEMAKIYDKQKRYDDAFRMFSEAQHTLSQTFEAKQHDPAIMQRNFTACRKWYTREHISGWSDFSPNDGMKDPIFVMGFPRSGTTLIETILGSHPQLRTTQEHPLLADLTLYLREEMGDDVVYPNVLQTLSDGQLLEMRQRYMRNAAAIFGGDLGGKTVVDKLPLNIPHLGMVQRIFPKAKILVMLRDPRDACLSAFMQTFQVNIAMANFYSLENTVRFYDIVMDLWLHFRSIIALDWMELRYEDMLEDLEGRTRTLCEFLDLEWSESMLTYYESAKGKHIRTPSYSGVIEPVYKSSAGRWKPYAKFFEPYQPMLARYVGEFGYEKGAL